MHTDGLKVGDEVYVLCLDSNDKNFIKLSKVLCVKERIIEVEAYFWSIPKHLVFKVDKQNKELLESLYGIKLPYSELTHISN